MGLFDWFGDVFAGDEADAVGRGTDTTATAEGGSDRRDTDQQRHGSHWDTVVAPDDREAAVKRRLVGTVEDGAPAEAGSHEGATVVGYRDLPSPVGATVVTLDGQVATGYPVADGVAHDLTVTDRTGWASGLEAWVDGSLSGATLTCFDTDFFAHRAAPPEGTTRVSLSVLLYSLGAADPDERVVTDAGEELGLGGMAGFFPYEGGAPDDYAVRTTVSAVDRWDWREAAGYRVRAPLFRTEDGADVEAAMYVADHNCADGYEPRPGDDVEGLGWLQGRFG